MRVEFNSNGFRADMNDSPEYKEDNRYEVSLFVKSNKTLIFGLLSLFLSLVNLPFGLFINLSRRISGNLDGISASCWITILVVMAAIFSVFSVSSAIASIVIFSKSEKNSFNIAGFISSILSFAICIIALVLIVIGIVA